MSDRDTEGPNIGLINSLALYARTNEYGFIETPYRKVTKGKWLTKLITCPRLKKANSPSLRRMPNWIRKPLHQRHRSARHHNEFVLAAPDQMEYMDVSPSQVVSVAASLIPFLEHDDANRA